MRASLWLAAMLVTSGPTAIGAPPQPPAKNPPWIAFDVRVITVPADLPATLGGQKLGQDQIVILTDEQCKAFVGEVQAGRRGSTIQGPKAAVPDGGRAQVRAGHTRVFDTGLEVTRVDGAAVLVPKKTPVDTGETMTLGGRVSADRRAVEVEVGLVSTWLAGETGLVIPVTSEEAGKAVTRHLVAPDVRTYRAEKAGLVVPAGGHVVVTCPTQVVEHRSVVRTPVLSDLPGVGRLFTSIACGRTEVRRLIVVSPKIMTTEK